MLCPVETQYSALVAVVASSTSDTYRCVAIEMRGSVALCAECVAVSTCETPPRDSLKHLGGTL